MPNKSDKEERDRFRKMVEDTHLAVCGSKELKMPGLVDKVDIMDKKLDRDFILLTPNRLLFFIGKTISRPVVLIVLGIFVASLLGISYADAIRIFLGID